MYNICTVFDELKRTMQQTGTEKFQIRTVSEITGVNAVTLRAWERRYGLIKPSHPKATGCIAEETLSWLKKYSVGFHRE